LAGEGSAAGVPNGCVTVLSMMCDSVVLCPSTPYPSGPLPLCPLPHSPSGTLVVISPWRRYNIHFHLCGDQSGRSVVRKNLILHSKQRCIVIHATFNATVDSNVAYNTSGQCLPQDPTAPYCAALQCT